MDKLPFAFYPSRGKASIPGLRASFLDGCLLAHERRAMPSMNPFAAAPADEIEAILRAMCTHGVAPAEAADLDDQIEALAPAAVELRDLGHIELNAKTLIDLGTLKGFTSLAADDRLSRLSRQRCAAIRDRMLVHGVRAVLGHI